jgi:hypothetical protein
LLVSVVSSIAAVFITLPLAAYIILFIGTKMITKNHRRSVRISMDISTVFFIFSVSYLIHAIWGQFLIWLILIVMIGLAALVVVVHYKVKQEIDIHKVLRGFWRLNFAFFFCAYLLLMMVGLAIRLTSTLNS